MHDKNLPVKPPSYQQTVGIEALTAVYNRCDFTATAISDIYHPTWMGFPKTETPLPKYSNSKLLGKNPPFPLVLW